MSAPGHEELEWSADGPRSRRFGDIYFNADGLAESRAVFLGGCGLPGAWMGRRRFTVAELGFGTGLNVLALLDLWRAARPAGGTLHVFSIEGFPLEPEDARRALGCFPELGDLAEPLLAQWPRVRYGVERIDFPGLGATVDVAIGEAAEALADWSGSADAWFLDGFAPAKNPDMWRPEVLDLIAARSAPGAGLATFTVAGAVRRGLAKRGFSVTRAAGHGRKRERLEARRQGIVLEPPPPTVAVIGGGIAGAALARALRALGVEPQVADPAPGGGASGNPAALVSPRLDVGGGPAARLYAQAWARAADLYRAEASDAVIAESGFRLAAGPKDEARFAALERSPLFRSQALALAGPSAAAAALDEVEAGAALIMRDALTVAPGCVLGAWLSTARLHVRKAGRLERTRGGWRVLDETGDLICEAEAVIVAAGHLAGALHDHVQLEPVRGQATWSETLRGVVQASSWGGYAVPTAEGGVLFGATHGRGDADSVLRPEDDALNLAALAERRPRLTAAVRALRLSSRASVRAATRDRLPLAGQLEQNLFVLGGLGGRGFTTAPLLAEHVAALVLGAPSPLPRSLAALVDPHRFRARAPKVKVCPRPRGVGAAA